MKTLALLLSDPVYDFAAMEAKKQGVEVATLCSVLLAEHFTTVDMSQPRSGGTNPLPNHAKGVNGHFDVAAHFPGYPRRSIEFAQSFVDEAMKFQHVCAFKNKRGIGIKPNFTFVEYLVSHRGTPGIVVSFYGEPHQYDDPEKVLYPGRRSYSRTRIEDSTRLSYVLGFIRKAHELKYGK